MTGNVAFMFVCTIMVFFMTPGLAFFYGGMVRRKNALNTMMFCMAMMGIGMLLWLLCGYSLSFGKDHAGIIGDLNKRRGRVMGRNPTGDGEQEIEAEVPMAEMTSYAIDLRSITQSRGTFSFHFVRYEEAPPAAQQKAIDDAKAIQEEG